MEDPNKPQDDEVPSAFQGYFAEDYEKHLNRLDDIPKSLLLRRRIRELKNNINPDELRTIFQDYFNIFVNQYALPIRNTSLFLCTVCFLLLTINSKNQADAAEVNTSLALKNYLPAIIQNDVGSFLSSPESYNLNAILFILEDFKTLYSDKLKDSQLDHSKELMSEIANLETLINSIKNAGVSSVDLYSYNMKVSATKLTSDYNELLISSAEDLQSLILTSNFIGDSGIVFLLIAFLTTALKLMFGEDYEDLGLS